MWYGIQSEVCGQLAARFEMFEVTPPAIGTAFRQVRPLLEQDGYVAARWSRFRYSTAAALLGSVTPPNDPPETSPTDVLIFYSSPR